MRKILFISLLAVSSLNAIDLYKVTPFLRQSRDLDSVPDRPFQRMQVVIAAETLSYSDKYNNLLNEVIESGLGGLIWQSVPENRSIMFGDTPLKEGQVVPQWIAGDGADFKIVEIGLDHVRMEHIPNGAMFDIFFQTRTSYSALLEIARPAKSSSRSSSAAAANNGSDDNSNALKQKTSAGSIFPKIQTFTRDAVESRREKEDELFFLKSGDSTASE